jgi:hypothetical protein
VCVIQPMVVCVIEDLKEEIKFLVCEREIHNYEDCL